ncbi:hypothetical protein CRG98_023230 [Punica granatum]|uniref:Uncharacterized protein n=1 Tax=Punica granatum TaxID=22663 RepID=A0A2I0JJ99_PUNGR|nr:hypothetical protein CRG98_023230 [Punica granatum]
MEKYGPPASSRKKRSRERERNGGKEGNLRIGRGFEGVGNEPMRAMRKYKSSGAYPPPQDHRKWTVLIRFLLGFGWTVASVCVE